MSACWHIDSVKCDKCAPLYTSQPVAGRPFISDSTVSAPIYKPLDVQQRIADALERIADALEKKGN